MDNHLDDYCSGCGNNINECSCYTKEEWEVKKEDKSAQATNFDEFEKEKNEDSNDKKAGEETGD